MGMATVRQAIVEFLDPTTSAITNLGTVYRALPKVANEADLFNFSVPGAGIGAVIYVFIEHKEDTRIEQRGLPGVGKMREYTVGLLCVLKSDLPSTFDGQDQFDAFIDSLTDWIYTSFTAGAPSTTIFSFGEGGLSGGPDLVFDFPVPKTMDGGVAVFQAIGRVTACETTATANT
jgi:hypothetical protein